MKTYVFPGQGSQKKGMGKDLFDRYRDITETANRILGYDIKTLCVDDPEKKLDFTQYTQPALYVVNALHYLQKCEADDTAPDFVAGHSLGEYNALHAAGGFDFETGLRLVQKRGALMAEAPGGAMAAVIGLEASQVEKVLADNDFHQIDVANYNTPVQVVISGPETLIADAKAIFKEAGAHYIKLNVSAAFHSSYMQRARDAFAQYLDEFDYADLKIPVISNVHAQPYTSGDAIKPNLADQLRSPVKWTDSMRYLLNQGDMTFEEIGHGTILTNMIKKIKAAVP